jgi:gliotoxin/aspirochlorine biosynthesis O-methyltransferase
MDANGVASIEGLLEHLISSLNDSLGALKTGATRAHLDAVLHNDTKLPEKKIATMASEAINLLHQIGQLLEPGHLVLADHFLG